MDVLGNCRESEHSSTSLIGLNKATQTYFTEFFFEFCSKKNYRGASSKSERID